MNTYENALKQLDVLINHLRNDAVGAGCADAEEQDLKALRFKTLRHVLSPNDQATIDKIAAYYEKYIR